MPYSSAEGKNRTSHKPRPVGNLPDTSRKLVERIDDVTSSGTFVTLIEDVLHLLEVLVVRSVRVSRER